MYKRKIMNELIAWKNSTGKKKALVIKGMRQIGKTFIVQIFAQENYENVVYINFKDNESAKKIFDGDFVINRITVDISALIPDVHFVPGKTIIIFDMILGSFPNAPHPHAPRMIASCFSLIPTKLIFGPFKTNKTY